MSSTTGTESLPASKILTTNVNLFSVDPESKTPYSDAVYATNPCHGQIKRPMNSFMLWSRIERKKISKQFPNMSNPDISKILASHWRLLAPNEKQLFNQKAAQLRLWHLQKFPNYKYHPRKKTTDDVTCNDVQQIETNFPATVAHRTFGSGATGIGTKTMPAGVASVTMQEPSISAGNMELDVNTPDFANFFSSSIVLPVINVDNYFSDDLLQL